MIVATRDVESGPKKAAWQCCMRYREKPIFFHEIVAVTSYRNTNARHSGWKQ